MSTKQQKIESRKGQSLLYAICESHIAGAGPFHSQGPAPFTVVKNETVDEGIDNAVRYMFPRFWIDETKCAKGISALDNYRRQWNAKQGCWGSKPQHDDNSHCADSLRMLACGLP